mmetsp:Transcript_519/g.1065  ORF Transcript_519/g.1065 Transcript_519/m.1065 type:complete len:387 (-) Transcript_519:281-1441(-)
MEFSNILLSANLAVMTFVAVSLWNQASSSVDKAQDMGALNFDTPIESPPAIVPSLSENGGNGLRVSTTRKNDPKQGVGALVKAEIGTVNSDGFYFVDPKEGEKDFYTIGLSTTTDKVDAPGRLPGCLVNSATCTRPNCVRPECRPWGHHYDTIYQQRLGPYSRDNVEPFQFLEIGFFNGFGYDLYREFLPQGECHSIEISCIAEGPKNEGKWPWGNFAEKNPRYQQYLDEDRLHCGDANNIEFLNSIWTLKMNRTDAPPLKVVVDDGAHIAEHMAQTMFFWFPRIEPRGLLIVEDIQPIHEANAFRTQFLPQIMKDLHYCGDPREKPDEICFPTLFPFLASIHCEMHICVFERNDTPAKELSLEESTLPSNALDLNKCTSSLNGHW